MRVAETERLDARVAVVEQHIRAENRHDLEGVMATFGADARYDDEPWADHRDGCDGVRAYYTELMRAVPDLAIEVKRRHVSSDCIVLEVAIVDALGAPALTPREPAAGFPLCGVLHFLSEHRLRASESTTIVRPRSPKRGTSPGPRPPARVRKQPPPPLTIARAYGATTTPPPWGRPSSAGDITVPAV